METPTRAVVLGCGLVGAAMVRDLASDDGFEVTAADVSEANLSRVARLPGVRVRRADLADSAVLRHLVEGADLVVGALPSRLGFRTLRTLIDCRKNYCDISFMVEDFSELDAAARNRGVTAVVDCGVAPGLANLLIGACASELDRVDNVVFYVGGLPRTRRWPYEYKAPFAPSDVLEEYVRPARVVENGKVVVKPALSEPELIDFDEVGTLEGFLTDGLRSLIRNIPARDMKEKTLRYPGHAERMRMLRETGFFSESEIEVGGARVRPRDVTKALLFPMWELEPGEREFTILRVVVEGESGGRSRRCRWDLLDEGDPATGEHSMARTTGFPCVIVARILAEGAFNRTGVFAPELLGAQPGLVDRVLGELAARGVEVRGGWEGPSEDRA